MFLLYSYNRLHLFKVPVFNDFLSPFTLQKQKRNTHLVEMCLPVINSKSKYIKKRKKSRAEHEIKKMQEKTVCKLEPSGLEKCTLYIVLKLAVSTLHFPFIFFALFFSDY